MKIYHMHILSYIKNCNFVNIFHFCSDIWFIFSLIFALSYDTGLSSNSLSSLNIDIRTDNIFCNVARCVSFSNKTKFFDACENVVHAPPLQIASQWKIPRWISTKVHVVYWKEAVNNAWCDREPLIFPVFIKLEGKIVIKPTFSFVKHLNFRRVLSFQPNYLLEQTIDVITTAHINAPEHGIEPPR